jgi:hypothetical protein
MKTVIFTVPGRTASFRRLRILAVRGSSLDTSNYIEFRCIVVAPVYECSHSLLSKACKIPTTMCSFPPWEHIVMGILPLWRCTPRSHGYGVAACTITPCPTPPYPIKPHPLLHSFAPNSNQSVLLKSPASLQRPEIR